jgi:MurNAc alpha-1-phosphate uridylyltransferase
LKALLLAPDPALALTRVRGRALALAHIQALVRAGVSEIVVAAPGPLLADTFGAAAHGARLTHVDSSGCTETQAASRALPALGDAPFLAVRAAVWCPLFDFADAAGTLAEKDALGKPYPADERDVAWVYLAKTPAGRAGDFAVTLYVLADDGAPRHAFAGIAVLRPEVLDGATGSLVDALRPHVARGRVGGELLAVDWRDCADPAQLAALLAPVQGALQ